MTRVRAIAFLPLLALAPGTLACNGPALLDDRRHDAASRTLEGWLVKITDDGIVPDGPVRVTGDVGGVAFLNDTRDRPVAVVFPDQTVPCVKGVFSASWLQRCEITRGFEVVKGTTATRVPLSPGEIASLCVHEPGTLTFEVHRVGAAPWTGTIEVLRAPAAAGGVRP
jgi:hypothetical protein